jgi:pimeloyl-ACP methyl ester carboxylesterase
MCGPVSGEPVILFHGMDASSTMWFPNVKEFSKNNRVYAIDFPLEAGKSVACGNKLSNREIVVFYNEIFAHFQMKNINLVAISRGGWMATFLALQPNNKIKRLILLSPAQTFGGIKNPIKLLSAIALKLFPSKTKLENFFAAFSYYPDKIDPLYKEQFYLANKFGNSKPRFLNMMRFSEKELKSITIPVLVLIGDHDIVNGEKSLEKAHELIPGVETAVIPNAGHFLSIDQSEIVNKKTVAFLTKK